MRLGQKIRAPLQFLARVSGNQLKPTFGQVQLTPVTPENASRSKGSEQNIAREHSPRESDHDLTSARQSGSHEQVMSSLIISFMLKRNLNFDISASFSTLLITWALFVLHQTSTPRSAQLKITLI
jgi:hypothetical protein